jgi:hypothetical protein
MTMLVRRKAAIAVAALAIVAGGGAAAAVAATGTSSHASGTTTPAFIRDLASRLDVSPGALTAAVRAALDDRIDAAVAAGRLSVARATVLKERVAARAAVPALGLRPLGRARLAAVARVVAAFLGISVPVLRSELASGQTLAQIASSTPGRSTAGLQAALIAAATARLARAVQAGRITATQEQRLLTRLSNRLPTLLERVWRAWPGRRRLGLRRLRRIF